MDGSSSSRFRTSSRTSVPARRRGRHFPPGGLALVVLAGVVGLAAPSQVVAQARGRTRFLHWSYQDAASVATDTEQRDVFYALGGAGIVAGFSLLDRVINHEVAEGYRGVFATYVDIANELGGPRTSIPVATVFLVSLATPNERFQDAAFTSVEALAYSGLLNYAVKYAVGRLRPEDARTQYHFKPFSGNTSFPSGHTNAVFAILTPWALYYPHPVTYTIVAVGAVGTGLARISREKHWSSDVAAGAVQGALTAYWLTKRHRRIQAGSKEAARLSVLPVVAPHTLALSLRVGFWIEER